MPDAISWQAVAAVAARLPQITVANGYRTNAGNAVLTEQVQADPARSPVERLSVYLDRAARTPSTLEGDDWTLQLVVEADVPSTLADAQQRAHAVMADVFDLFPSGGTELPIDAGFVDVEAQTAEFLTRVDGANSSVAQIRLQATVRLP
ncbi:MAG: hypothetical protein ACK5X3_09240 [Pseudomonadota bacterium]